MTSIERVAPAAGRVAPAASAADRFQDHADLWSAGEIRPAELVAAACDALVAGLDSPALRTLAACTRGEADYDVPDLLPGALGELGLVFRPAGGAEGREAGARALARRMLAGDPDPRGFAFHMHRTHGHGLPLTERLAELNDEYDEYGGHGCFPGDRTPAEIDAEVMAEARRLAVRPRRTADRPAPAALRRASRRPDRTAC
ncbi:hypothetical protein [Streptomyces sp. CAU 1734]|uniref:hypothetical protein n=1 Tax=Streptomyces sp. CAU 1734 TaxID=3140360 RepID=UPI0032603609